VVAPLVAAGGRGWLVDPWRGAEQLGADAEGLGMEQTNIGID
jgi:hypothetical protein